MNLHLVPAGFLVPVAFVLGALFGSFLNVVVARVPRGESILWPPSHCFSCGQRIRATDNVPIFSYLILRGRCRACGARYSGRYALLELAYALVWAAAVARHGLTVPALREILLMGFLIPLAAIDLETWLLPRVITIPGIAVGLAVGALEGRPALADGALGAAVGYTGIVLIGFVAERIVRREAMGGGDKWLMSLIGAFLGVRALLPVLLLSALQGSVLGGLMLWSRRRHEKRSASEAPPAGEPDLDVRAAPASALPSRPEATSAPAAGHPAAEDRPAGLEAPGGEAIEPARLPDSAEAEALPDEEEWVPDPTAIPYGPFLALAAAEVLYFTQLPSVLFPF